MGFNISGIATAINLQSNLGLIEKEIGFKLAFEKEIDFETAASNWKEEGICDIYYTENATLIFINFEYTTNAYSFQNQPTLTFALSETSMAFCFYYCENGEIIREKSEVEEKIIISEGNPLEIENIQNDTSEVIFHLINKTIGTDFNSINLEEKGYRYKLVKINKTGNTKHNTDKENNISKYKTLLFIYKHSNWIIAIGIIFTILFLTKVYDNRFGLLIIIFGFLLRYATKWILLKKLARNKH